jgi:hypothetical protein
MSCLTVKYDMKLKWWHRVAILFGFSPSSTIYVDTDNKGWQIGEDLTSTNCWVSLRPPFSKRHLTSEVRT